MEPIQQQVPTMQPELPMPGAAPADQMVSPEPPLPVESLDPQATILQALLAMPGPEAVRRVYQLAVSAAKAKARLKTAVAAMDARSYHAALSAVPEVQFADELSQARRELDVLAAERRRLNLEAVKARDAGRPASIYEMQAESADLAMGYSALGMLMFLAIPTTPIPETSAAPAVPLPTPQEQGVPPDA